MTSFTPITYKFGPGFGEAEVLDMRTQLARQLHEAGVSGDASYALINVLDEFCCNMMEHANATLVEIEVTLGADGSLAAVLCDDGAEFDPVKAIEQVSPNQPAHVTDRRLGLYMISLMAKDLKYSREGKVNRLEFSMKR